MVQALIREDPDDRLNRWLLLDQIVLVGNTPAAITAASLARETRPDDPVRVPTLARVVLLNRDPRDGSEALGLLRPIARTGESEPRRQALRMMADLEGPEICRWLRGQGLAEEAPVAPGGNGRHQPGDGPRLDRAARGSAAVERAGAVCRGGIGPA